MGKNISKNISKSLINKYSHKLLDHAKTSAPDLLRTSSKRVIQKTEEAAGDLVCNKIGNKITRVSRSSPQKNLEKTTDEFDKEISKERYTSPEEIQKNMENLSLIQ